MFKYFEKLIWICLIICSSCGDQNLDEISIPMGEEYISSNAKITYTDTLSLNLSTVIKDSLITSGSGRALVGQYFHPDFGIISSEAVCRFKLPSSIALEKDDIYDSITICFNLNDYYIGDTTQLFKFSINQIETDLISDFRNRILDNVQNLYYNTSEIKQKEVPLLEYAFYPRMSGKKKFEIKINDTFGQDLFSKLVNKDFKNPSSTGNNNSIDQTLFHQYFQGIVIRDSDIANSAIIGFNANPEDLCFKLYYNGKVERNGNEPPAITISMGDAAFQFNSIHSDRTSTVLENLTNSTDDIYASMTNDRTYIQGGTGIMTKVRIPNLTRAFQHTNINKLIKAELILKPIDPISKINELPSNLIISTIDNNMETTITDQRGNPIPMVLRTNSEDFENKYYYSIDITKTIIQELLKVTPNEDMYFLIKLPENIESNSITSLIFGGSNSTKYKPKLNLYTYNY